jgi:hypothetical protein
MIGRILVCGVVLLASSISGSFHFGAVATAAEDDVRPGAMTCEPSILRPGDTLHVTLPFPHGPYFTIRPPNAPHGFSLILTHPFATQEQAGKHMIAGDQFVRMREIKLSVDRSTAVEFTNDYTPVKIFRRPGKYRLEVGDQFETEAKILEGQCTVEYRR